MGFFYVIQDKILLMVKYTDQR